MLRVQQIKIKRQNKKQQTADLLCANRVDDNRTAAVVACARNEKKKKRKCDNIKTDDKIVSYKLKKSAADSPCSKGTKKGISNKSNAQNKRNGNEFT